MVANMNYYRAVRREDPSYTAYDAFKEWMRDNPDVAVELAKKIWPELDPDTFPMDWDEMRDYLEGLDTMDVFFAGYYSNPNVDHSDDHFVIDGYGHFSSISDRKYEKMCVDFMCGWGYEEIAFGDKYPVPRELADVLALWGKMVRTENRRPSTCKGGCTGCGKCGRPVVKKAPSENRKITRQSKNTKSSNTKSSNTKSSNTKSNSTKSNSTKSKSVKSKTPAKRCRA